MTTHKTINTEIHHCRRDLNDAAKIITKYLNGNRFDKLRKALSESEEAFAKSAKIYPPLPYFNMRPDYFDGNWKERTVDTSKSEEINALRKVTISIEKAYSRSTNPALQKGFGKLSSSLKTILILIDSF